MGKNKHGGCKHKKYARDRGTNAKTDIKHLKKEAGQEYAFVKDKLGNSRMRVCCFDKKIRLATIRGKLKKRCWINVADIVLVSLRDFQDDKCDIIQKFTTDQTKTLVKNKLITEAFVKDGNAFEDYDYDPDQSESDVDSEFDQFTSNAAKADAFTMDDYTNFSSSAAAAGDCEQLDMEDLINEV